MMLTKENKAMSGQMSIPDANAILSEIDIPALPQNVFFGNIMYDEGGTYGPRIQEHMQIVLIRRGEAIVHIDGVRHPLQHGEVAFLKQGHKEYFEFARKEKTYHSWCHFHWDLPENASLLVNTLPFKTAVSSRLERIVDLGLSLEHDPQSLLPSRSHLAAAVFWEYVSSLGLAEFSSENARLPAPVKRVQAYISQNYLNHINLHQLSEIAFVTPEHLTRMFRKHLATTPIRYLWSVRVQQGVSLLTHTGLTVEKIAFSCGFKTAAHFSRLVKQHTGQTPSEIRSQQG